MTDVVEIARSRRSRLVAEIAKLEDFIRMAETLLALERSPGREEGWLTGAKASPTIEDATGCEMPGSDVVEDPATDHAAPGVKAYRGADKAGAAGEDANGGNDHFLFLQQKRGDDEELLLTPEVSADEEQPDPSVGQKLRQRRWMMGMTKKQLAERLKIGVDELQNFELGVTKISAARIWELAAALNVPTSYFFEDPKETSADEVAARDTSNSEGREEALAKTA